MKISEPQPNLNNLKKGESMGTLTTIQRFSLHDGPGIRSTVFFKGCNLRCKWCHNPETFSFKPQVLYYQTKCVGCGACAAACACHTGANGKMVFDRTNCTDCGKCAEVCFTGALEKCGKEYSVNDVLFEVLQDQDYYEQSGGGVTLSGGEVLLQSDFAAELLAACKEKGLSTAIESNLSTDFSEIEKLLPHLDLVMCDLKLYENELHEKWTGIGNARIKENMEKLAAAGVPMIVRTAVIPNVNDSEEEIEKIAEFVGKLPSLKYYELLNFNPLGGSKYLALDAQNLFKDCKPFPDARMAELKAAAEKHCKTVRVG